MGYPAFTLPFTAVDIPSAARDIVFEVQVDGSGDLTATLGSPPAGGWYNYKTGGPARSDSLAKALADALAAAHLAWGGGPLRSFTAGEVASGLPGRTKISMTGGVSNLVIKWTDAGTTFDGSLLGFDTSADSTAVNKAEATWPAGRMWLPPRTLFTLGTPKKRVVVGSETVEGRWEVRKIHDGPKVYPVRLRRLPLARLLLSATEDSYFYQGVLDMVQNDPNTPLEALWAWMGIRAPLRYHPDRDTDATYTELQIASLGQIGNIEAIMTPAHDSGPNPLPDVAFDLQDYVA